MIIVHIETLGERYVSCFQPKYWAFPKWLIKKYGFRTENSTWVKMCVVVCHWIWVHKVVYEIQMAQS